jgi:CheY-like chemotaxis protein
VAKPAIITVDDDPQVLDAVQRDLRARYAAVYRIVGANSGPEALEALRSLKQRGDEVALIVADQRMPDMTGTEFLLAAAPTYPSARKVLLTAYADTDAAIQAIAVELDRICSAMEPPRTASIRSSTTCLLMPGQHQAPSTGSGARHHLVAGDPERRTSWPATRSVSVPRHRARLRRRRHRGRRRWRSSPGSVHDGTRSPTRIAAPSPPRSGSTPWPPPPSTT